MAKLWIPEEDVKLAADELSEKYNPGLESGEHPFFKRENWRWEVAQENTISGYWDWVVSQIEQFVDEAINDQDDSN